MILGRVISGKFGEICVRQKSSSDIEIGEILVAEDENTTFLLQVYDLEYGSQVSQQNLELISGMDLEEETNISFFEENLRNYKLAYLKNLITLKRNQSKTSKTLPNFFSPLRSIRNTDLSFLPVPQDGILLGNLRSGSKTLDTNIFVPGKLALSHHILIPASTGKGKSLDGKEEVILEKDGKYIIKPIAEIVNNSTIYEGSKAISMNPQNCATEFKRITKFVKHDAPKFMYKVLTEAGREVLVTGDHNLFVLRAGKLVLLETTKISKEDYLPAPLLLPEISNQREINLFHLLKGSERIYVEYDEVIKRKLKSKEECIKILSEFYTNPARKYADFVITGNKIKLVQLIKILKSPLSNEDLSLVKLTDRVRTLVVDALYKITPEFLELLGYYIAEGYSYDTNVFRISASESDIQKNLEGILKKLGLRYFWVKKKGKNVDLAVSSSLFGQILRNIDVGTVSGDKKLPSFYLSLSNKNLKTLLRTYLEGDGGVNRQVVKINRNFNISVTTKSKKLAHDVCIALNRFGVFGRIKIKWKRATNTSHLGNWYFTVVISGRDNMDCFLKKVGFKFARKNAVLKGRLNYKGNTNIDVIPVSSEEFKNKRIETGLSQTKFARHIGCSPSIISFIERGERRPSRSLMSNILSKFDNFDGFSYLLKLRWDKIKEIKKIKYLEKEVYDLTIEDNHTFLAGFGGLFVHNSNLLSVMLWNMVDKLFCGTLILDPHDEYYGRNGLGLKDHPSRMCSYYSSDPPPGGKSLKISLNNIRPQHFNGSIHWTDAQRDCVFYYHKHFGERWIERILTEENNPLFHESTINVVKRKLSSLLNIRYTNGIVSQGIFHPTQGSTTLSDIMQDLEAGKAVILDTSSFSGSLEILVGSLVTTYVFNKHKYYKSKGTLDTKPVISIVIEEAPRVLGKEVLEQGPNIFSTIAREGRKFKVGLIAVTQLPSLIPRQILANMNTKIILGIEMGPERNSIIESASQDLSRDQRAIASLDMGEAIVSSNFTRFAMPIKIPYFKRYVEDYLEEHKPKGSNTVNSFSGMEMG